jgi:hypothetical protein
MKTIVDHNSATMVSFENKLTVLNDLEQIEVKKRTIVEDRQLLLQQSAMEKRLRTRNRFLSHHLQGFCRAAISKEGGDNVFNLAAKLGDEIAILRNELVEEKKARLELEKQVLELKEESKDYFNMTGSLMLVVAGLVKITPQEKIEELSQQDDQFKLALDTILESAKLYE